MDEEDELIEPAHEHIHGGDDIYGDLIDDGIIESLIIVGLAAALAFLVYYRQQRQLNNNLQQQQQGQQTERNQQAGDDHQGEQNQQAQEQAQVPDRGVFPAPGDPDYGQWVAGGVAH